MRLFVDTADLNEIAEWAQDDRVSGFTTNPSLMRQDWYVRRTAADGMGWAQAAVKDAQGKPISIDGPPEVQVGKAEQVIRKVTEVDPVRNPNYPINLTAVCTVAQADVRLRPHDIISVFAGRIMDTGRDPQPVIDAARQTGAQVLWASVREPYNIVQAEAAGCDIITVPPAILRKYLDWHGLPLETVAARTIAQFDRDREGLWTT